jgi:hypothetical protein
VSETIGFVFTFAMIVLMVGLVYTTGTGALADLRQAEQSENAEYAMEALAESVGTLERGDPARTNELRVGGGSFTVTDDTTLDVSVAGTSPYSVSIRPRGLAYQRDATTIVLSGGAVIRSDHGNAVMLREPSFVCTPDVAIVSLVHMKNVGDTDRIGTSGSVIVEARTIEQSLRYPQDATVVASDATNVTVTVNGDRASGWNDYFDAHPRWTANGAGYTCASSRVYVRETTVGVRLFD